MVCAVNARLIKCYLQVLVFLLSGLFTLRQKLISGQTMEAHLADHEPIVTVLNSIVYDC